MVPPPSPLHASCLMPSCQRERSNCKAGMQEERQEGERVQWMRAEGCAR